MLDQDFGFIVHSDEPSLPLWPVRPARVPAFLDSLPSARAVLPRATGFTGAAQELALLVDSDGLAGAVLGLGEDRSPHAFGDLAFRLPEGSTWRLEPGEYDAGAALLGFCLGAYRYAAFKDSKRAPARLLAPAESKASLIAAAAIWMGRDLINAPANVLGPAELADFAVSLGMRYGATTNCVSGEHLERNYPTIATVGRGSARPPVVASLQWASSCAGPDAPLISLCGKGVCFDTGGYDIKPSAGMLRMKKDMGGAAAVLGLARMIMESDLPIRMAVRVGCVENSISGSAMRPSDVVRTRRGLTVEIGNTDAEGRLVLCDLLAEASDENPALLLDCATLTGAARVALGPELPALFCDDDSWADKLVAAGRRTHDPCWRMPLWAGYGSWLDSRVADLNNVSTKPFAGAITAALFLHRFVAAGVPWCHFDLYAWNDQALPGRPEGGEIQTIRAVFSALTAI